MGILKHVSSHNLRYSDVIDYLTKKHDEESGNAILDEHNQMVDREEFLIQGINCTPENFATLCLQDSIKFDVNRKKDEVKTHQYILSFDPKDREKGLTLEEAQRAGEEFAKKFFPGHRVIVCAHPDGHNGSGNIHVHIVICSVRFENRTPEPDYMKLTKDGSVKESEYKAGCKHQDTAKLRHVMNDYFQNFCRENGYGVIEKKASAKVTDKEYKAKKIGQKQLDQDNKNREKKGQAPVQKEFKSKKDDLRTLIAHAASVSKDWDQFVWTLRNCYSRSEEIPPIPPLPYPKRQEMWACYKELNTGFWEEQRTLSEKYRKYLSDDFKALKERKNLEWQSKNRRNSEQQRRSAAGQLFRHDTVENIKGEISRDKKEQATLFLFKDTYSAYSKAAKLALTHNLEQEANECLRRMEELKRRQTGYWEYGWNSAAHEFDLTSGEARSKITWRSTTEEELSRARDVFSRIQERCEVLDNTPSKIVESHCPIDVKVTRGVISFKHPDLDRWTRGKSLGEDFELEALVKTMEKNRDQERAISSGTMRSGSFDYR